MNFLRILLNSVFVFFSIQLSFATDTLAIKKTESPFCLTLELSTKYMWRGIEYGNAPTTFAILSYEKAGFSAYAEGVYAINGSHSEVDLGMGYTFKDLFVGLADYYYPSSVGEKDKYFKFSSRNTGHYVEAYTMYSPYYIPLRLTLSCYVFGADKRKDGSQAYSSYAEVGYIYKFKNDNNLSIAIGANLNRGFYTDYESGFKVVNITLKYATAFKLGNFRLPVSASYVLNPYREKSFFTLSLYFDNRL